MQASKSELLQEEQLELQEDREHRGETPELDASHALCLPRRSAHSAGAYGACPHAERFAYNRM